MEHTHNESHNESRHESHHETHHTQHQGATKLKGHAGALEAWLLPMFSNLPHIPEGGRKTISDIVPWLAIIFGVLSLIGLLGSGLFGIILSPLLALGGGLRSIILLLTVILGIASAVLSILAFRPMRAMKKTGWDYLFYSLILSAVSFVISLVGMMSSVGSVVGILLGAYILFEIRSRYH